MGGVSNDAGVAFDFDGVRKGWRLYAGNKLLQRHEPGPYLKGGKRSVRRLCMAAKLGWGDLIVVAGRIEPETASWLTTEITGDEQPIMVEALVAFLDELGTSL